MYCNKYLCFLLLVSALEVTGDCNLALKSDFGRPAPVFIKDSGFLAPNASTGAITLRRSETLLVACPGDKRRIVLSNQTSSYDVLEAHCIKDDTFRLDRWIGRFRDIRCNTQPWFKVEEAGGCGGRHKLYRVGYTVKSSFHQLYEACFDADTVMTLYVKHQLTPSSLHIQTSSSASRPSFTEGNLFGTVSMSKLYNSKNQADRINEILGSNANSYVTKNEQLTRGHLAPRADFTFLAEQRATFHYVNSAPQWRKANSGAWAAIEDGLRRRVNALGRPVAVYTGSIGVSSLEGKPFYLAKDKNNNDVVPVPMYFYKLVYDELTKTAVAFVAINSSANNKTDPRDLDICSSTCERYSWLKKRGNSACCHYEELAEILPPLKVTGLLDI